MFSTSARRSNSKQNRGSLSRRRLKFSVSAAQRCARSSIDRLSTSDMWRSLAQIRKHCAFLVYNIPPTFAERHLYLFLESLSESHVRARLFRQRDGDDDPDSPHWSRSATHILTTAASSTSLSPICTKRRLS